MTTHFTPRSLLRPALLVLAAHFMLTAAAFGTDLPAQAQRIWAPTGDLIGNDNHATATFETMDAYGNLAKTGEDWQYQAEKSGFGLFNWQHIWPSGYQMGARGAGGTAADEGFNGNLGLWGQRPGRFSYDVNYRTFDQFSDRTSELRAGTFGLPPAPPALAATPILDWKRTDATLGYRLTSSLALRGGLRALDRDGAKASLLRGATGSAAPNLKGFDASTSREAWLGLDYAAEKMSAGLDGTFTTQDGDRNLGTGHAYRDDRTSWRTSLSVNWDAAASTRVLGFGTVSRLESSGTEVWQTVAVAPAGETKSSGGQLGVIRQLGRGLTARLAANFQQSTTSAEAGATAVDRDRTAREYRLHLTHTGLARTRLEMDYRLRQSTREQVLVNGGTFTTDQDKTTNALVVKGRHRFSRSVLLKAQAGWSRLEREQTRDWDDPALAYWLDDYNRAQLDWKLGLQLRPHTLVRLDLGHQLVDRKFENQITDGVETTYQANRGFANLNWNPRDWLTVYGLVSVGLEQYEMGDAVSPDAGMGPLNYDGTTWRYVPGVVVQVTPKLQAEASYEGVRFEDRADTDGTLGVLQSDHDRTLARLSWQARADLTVSATYRRHEFAEQRWDNYIHDLYGLSVSGRF